MRFCLSFWRKSAPWGALSVLLLGAVLVLLVALLVALLLSVLLIVVALVVIVLVGVLVVGLVVVLVLHVAHGSSSFRFAPWWGLLTECPTRGFFMRFPCFFPFLVVK